MLAFEKVLPSQSLTNHRLSACRHLLTRFLRIALVLAVVGSTSTLAQAEEILHGRVIDQEGKPIAGATVRVHSGRTYGIAWSLPRTVGGEQLTNERGLFAVTVDQPDELWAIDVRMDGFLPKYHEPVPVLEGTSVDVVLRLPTPVLGRLIDTTGQGVEGVRITAQSQEPMPPRLPDTVITGRQGEFDLTGLLPPGKARIKAEVSRNRLIVHELIVPPATEGKVDVTLDLGSGYSLVGKVLGPADQPLAKVRVMARRESNGSFSAGSTDENGGFALQGLEKGPHTLIVEHQDLPAKKSNVSVPNPEAIAVHLNVLQQLTVQVIDWQGQPMPGLKVSAVHKDAGSYRSTVSNPRGKAHLARLDSASYDLAVETQGVALMRQEFHVGTEPEQLVVIRMPWLTSLKGRIVGMPDDGTPDSVTASGTAKGDVRMADVEPDGTFEIRYLSAGPWLINGSLGNRRLNREHRIEISPEQTPKLIELRFDD